LVSLHSKALNTIQKWVDVQVMPLTSGNHLWTEHSTASPLWTLGLPVMDTFNTLHTNEGVHWLTQNKIYALHTTLLSLTELCHQLEQYCYWQLDWQGNYSQSCQLINCTNWGNDVYCFTVIAVVISYKWFTVHLFWFKDSKK